MFEIILNVATAFENSLALVSTVCNHFVKYFDQAAFEIEILFMFYRIHIPDED